MEYYSVIKRNEIELFVVRWMDLESAYRVKSEREKQIPYANTYIWNLKNTREQWICRACSTQRSTVDRF